MREDIIKNWFNAWNNPDWDDFESTFTSDIFYVESWGPYYSGIEQIKIWFNKWHINHKLAYWNINRIYTIDGTSIVEWTFSCSDGKSVNTFEGNSIIEWDNLKIKVLKEYASTLPHYNPIEDKV